MSEHDLDVEEIGVAAGEGESWSELVERREQPTHCPACGTEGTLQKTLAPGQRWCPTDDCGVVSFQEVEA